MRIEAHLARGACRLGQRDFKLAQYDFEAALSEARGNRLAKQIVHAHLQLAELFASDPDGDLQRAVEQWRFAQQALTSVSSRYLTEKADRVRQSIERRRGVWMVFRDSLMEKDQTGNRFKQLKTSLERWMLERLEENANLTLTDRATLMGVSASAYLQKCAALGITRAKKEATGPR
jgi:hypothetical protein